MITSANLKPDDVLIVRVAVGNMPPTRIQEYMDTVKVDMKTVFGSQPMLFIPKREGDTELHVLNRE